MHTTPAGRDIFDDLGHSPEKAASLKIRRDLMRLLVDTIRARDLTQQKAAEIFGVAQPRVSDLVRGKISLFTIDALVSMLAKAGIEVAVEVVGTVTDVDDRTASGDNGTIVEQRRSRS